MCPRYLPFLAVLLPLLQPTKPQAAGRGPYKNPLGLAVDQAGQRAYVVLHAAGAVAVVDLKAGRVLEEIRVGTGPHDVALAGGCLFVTCDTDDTLVKLDLATHAVAARWKVPQAPCGLAVVPNASSVFVACHDAKVLCRLDPANGKFNTLAMPAWPERVKLQRDAHSANVLVLSAEGSEARVSTVDPGKLQVLHTPTLAGIGNARGLAGKKGNDVLVVHQRPRTRVPATQIAQGWVFTNAVSTIPLSTDDTRTAHGNRVRILDLPNQGYADPSDIALLPDGRLAFVACAGADTVLALREDRLAGEGLGPAVFSARDRPLAGDDLTLSRRYVRARLATQANPRRLALSGDGKILVVANYLGDSLTVIDTDTLRVLRHIALGGPEPDAARRGEMLFHSSKMTFHGQFTCASCHPGGGSDGLTWDLSRDGIGNFMNTRSLHGVGATAPYGWLGSSPTLADRVAGTLRTLHRHEPQGTEVADVVAYLKTLPPPRPLPQVQKDEPARARGRAIFQGKGKCAACHRRPPLDDDIAHDVGTRIAGDTQEGFDTPSLRGVARTAPYLHHGLAKTLEEVFTSYNPRHRHGAAHLLTRDELNDLIVYLKSL
jgi:DNA-binding beta-propeller fold protein YncE